MKIYSTIIKPISTEKSSLLQEGKQYAFLVNSDSTKIDIKKSLEVLYGTKVQDVRVMISPRKKRNMGKWIIVKRPKFKKAIVTFIGKKTIDPNKLKEIK